MRKLRNIHVYGALLGVLLATMVSCAKNDENTIEPNDYCYIQEVTLETLTRYEYSTDESGETTTTTITYNGSYYPIEIDQRTGIITNSKLLLQNTDRTIVPLTIEGEGYVFYRKLSDEEGWIEFDDGDDVDFTEPVVFRVTATDGNSSRDYVMTLNIRENDPDSYTWEQMMPQEGVANPFEGRAQRRAIALQSGIAVVSADADGKLFLTTTPTTESPTWTDAACTGAEGAVVSSLQSYGGKLWMNTATGTLLQSEDGRTWSSVAQSEAQSVKLLAASTAALYALIDGTNVCASTDGSTWTAVTLDSDADLFPTDDFASVAYTQSNGTKRVILVGQTAAASTASVWNMIVDEDEPWAYFANPSSYILPWSAIQGTSIVSYANILIAIGRSATTYKSTDNGLTWHEYTKFALNDSQRPAEGEHIAATVAGEYVWLFSGARIWRARVNNYGEE